ncbi:MAG: cyanophycin synthetase [Burkholderiaceae bacterium]
MDITRIRALRGPNLWTRRTAIEALLTCTGPERDLASMPGFETRLRARFPEIGALHPIGHEGRVSMADVLSLAALALQAEAGCPVTFSRCTETIDEGTFQVVVEYTEEPVGRLAVQCAQALCQAAEHDQPFDLPGTIARLRELDEDIRLGPSTGSIVDAAVARDIPYRRLTEGSLVQFGWGSRQRRIQAAETDCSSAIAESIAQDKELTKRLLTAAGVPVPRGRPVTDADDAWAAACDVGLPVVIKPRDGNQGKGVTVNVETREHVATAYAAAAEYRDDVMVERFIPGHDFRMLIVGNKLLAAARRDPPHVIGDGIHTVAELVEAVNADPRRGTGHATSLTKIRMDDIARARLALQGMTTLSVPALGARVILRNNANLSTGGTATDVTDDVHPDLAERAIDAARMIGLDVCGVDIVAESVLVPLEEQGGGIVEVNAAPGLRMHITPSFGKGRRVGEAIIDAMFEPGDNGRIPVVAVTGTNGKTTTVRLIAKMLACTGKRVGMTNTDGVYVSGKRIDTGDCSGPRSARNVLMHPEVDAAVFETARGGLLREGLGFDRCEVAVVTNIGNGDHLGLNYITTVEDLAVLKRVIVQNVAPEGHAVLNADDPIVAAMAKVCPGKIIYFARSRTNPVYAAHLLQGGKGVHVENDAIIVMQGKTIVQHILLTQVPFTSGGRIGFQVDNALASIAAGWALGLEWPALRTALLQFGTDATTVPGRFNTFQYRDATIIADYGHNPDAMSALVSAVGALQGRRRHVVISGAGDRRDEDIRNQTRILGEAFESVILYQDQCQRGREDGEVLALLREGLVGATRTDDVEEIHGEFNAIDRALEKLGPQDVCLILIDQVEEALAHITRRVSG